MTARFRNLRGERGFMLMEMIVATALGMVVFLALLGLVDASQTSSARVQDRVDGTQRGRVAMDQVLQRLRSQICIGSTPPIIAGTTTEVTFYADLGNDDFRAEKRRIYVLNGQLKEDVYDSTGTFPAYVFPASPTRTRTFMTGIKQAKDSAGNPMPYFSYWGYDTNTPPSLNQQVNPPFSATDPARIVKVMVAFSADTREDRVDTTFVNGVTARMADPSASDTSKRGPQCS
jgi:hypothetical protein